MTRFNVKLDLREGARVMKLYKLTDQNAQTMNGTQWGPGVTHETDGTGSLCGPGWLHAYEHPLLAVLFNPIHADFYSPRMFDAEGSGASLRDEQLKIGVTSLTTIREIPFPEITIEHRVKFAIMCALNVCSGPGFISWANSWLDGTDRSAEAADAAAKASEAWVSARATKAAWAAAKAARAAAKAKAAAKAES